MIAEIVSLVVWVLGSGKADKVALRESLVADKAIVTGGYQKDVKVTLSDTPVETCVWPHVCSN